jgi:UDP-N-acetylglucosamine 1-carboxyvinyltransferase
MGANISGMGTSRLTVQGVSSLHGASYAVMPDRIEAGTYAIAVAIAGGAVELVGARRDCIAPLLDLLEQAGTQTRDTNRGIALHRNGARPAAVDLTTDLQAQFMAMMTVAEGTSVIRETIFENRFMHVPELGRLGADIRVNGDVATVRGVAKLKGAPVMATDLRASSSLVLAGLVAEGETIVNRVYHLDRGFDRLEEKLRRVGAQIVREKE